MWYSSIKNRTVWRVSAIATKKLHKLVFGFVHLHPAEPQLLAALKRK